MRHLTLIALIILGTLVAGADRTTRKNLRVKRTTAKTDTTAVADTVMPSAGMLIVSGYDKPLRSRRESLFVTNRSNRTLKAVTLRITYLDADGRQLHVADRTLNTDIPAGETRQLTFPSWDRQMTFYYLLTGKPRTADGSPYTVTVQPVTAVFPRR